MLISKTKEEKLYDKKLENIEILYPNKAEQAKVSEIIVRIIRRQVCLEDRMFLESLIKDLMDKGAEVILLACTDLANLLKENKNTLDTTEILINSIKREMGGE